MKSCTSIGLPVRWLSIAPKTSAEACTLAATVRLHLGPPSSHCANCSISQVFSHFGCVEQRDLLALAFAVPLAGEVVPHEHLDLAAVEDRGAELAVDPDIFAGTSR